MRTSEAGILVLRPDFVNLDRLAAQNRQYQAVAEIVVPAELDEHARLSHAIAEEASEGDSAKTMDGHMIRCFQRRVPRDRPDMPEADCYLQRTRQLAVTSPST